MALWGAGDPMDNVSESTYVFPYTVRLTAFGKKLVISQSPNVIPISIVETPDR
jgi:hypothetical protein